MKLLLSLLTLTTSLSIASAGAVGLTTDNFDAEMSAGKNAFIKSMKPAWDQLGDEYADSSSVLIADVDCTDEDAKPLCEKYEVKGYPTIKYFVDGDEEGQQYQKGRDYDSLKTFVSETLEVKCDVNNTDNCSEKEVKYLDKMKATSPEDRKKQLDRLAGMQAGKMKADLKKWLNQRLHILRSLDEQEL